MFDFGNDDKEKLRENMEQIKQMVNEGSAVGEDFEDEAVEGDFGDTGFDQGETQDFDSPGQTREPEAGTETQSFDAPAQESEPEPQGEELEDELDEFEEKFGKEQQDSWSQESQAQQNPQQQQLEETPPDTPPQNQQRSKTTQGGVKDARGVNELSDEVPSPPETRDIDVPEIDRGPLFLRQQKFLKAKQMIEDMLYLADDMERTVNDLESGLQEDREIESDVRQILMEFEDDRTAVEDIISPREE